VAKPCIVAQEDVVLLSRREDGGRGRGLFKLRGKQVKDSGRDYTGKDLMRSHVSVGPHKMIPDRHEERVVLCVVGVMTEVELWGVEEVGQRGPGSAEEPVPELDVGVAKGVDDVKEEEVGSNNRPVLGPKDKKGDEHRRAKVDNVDDVLDKVLDGACGREGADGLVVVPVHADHVTGDVEPPVDCIVDGLDKDYVEDKGGEGGARVHLVEGREEHAGEEALEQHLAPHVHHNWDQVVVAFSVELTLRDLHDVGSLLILERHHQRSGLYIQYD
jgi:hypothetical protein